MVVRGLLVVVHQLEVRPEVAPDDASALDAFDAFDRTYRSRLTRYLRRCDRNGDGPEAADVVQETLVRAYHRFHELDSVRDPWPWLVVVARHVIVDMARAGARIVVTEDEEFQHLLASERGPDEQAAANEDMQLVARALSAIPPKQRAVLKMRLYDEMSFCDIGEFAGVSEERARQWFCRGRVALARQFTALGGSRYGLAPVMGLLGAGLKGLRRAVDKATTAPVVAVPATMGLAVTAGLAVVALAPFVGTAVDMGTLRAESVAVEQQRPDNAGVHADDLRHPKPALVAPVAPAGGSAAVVVTSEPVDGVDVTARVAENPFQRGETDHVGVTIDTPVGPLEVGTQGVVGEGERPVCEAAALLCS